MAVPLCIKADPSDVGPGWQYIGDEPALTDVADIFANKYKQPSAWRRFKLPQMRKACLSSKVFNMQTLKTDVFNQLWMFVDDKGAVADA